MVAARLEPREAAAVSAHVLCTPYNRAPVYSVTSSKMFSEQLNRACRWKRLRIFLILVFYVLVAACVFGSVLLGSPLIFASAIAHRRWQREFTV